MVNQKLRGNIQVKSFLDWREMYSGVSQNSLFLSIMIMCTWHNFQICKCQVSVSFITVNYHDVPCKYFTLSLLYYVKIVITVYLLPSLVMIPTQSPASSGDTLKHSLKTSNCRPWSTSHSPHPHFNPIKFI